MKTRFELEDEIMKLYAFVDNIENAVEFLAESDVDPKVIDAMSNILLGTSTLIGLHAEKMLDTMSQCFKLNEYCDIKETEQVDDMKYRLKKCCKKWEWDSTSTNPIHDMSYDPNKKEEDITHYWLRAAGNSDVPLIDPNVPSLTTGVSEFPVEVPLTNADNRVTTKCSGKCHSTMSSFEYQ